MSAEDYDCLPYGESMRSSHKVLRFRLGRRRFVR